MFFIGGLPALLSLFIRSKVKESEAWREHRTTDWTADIGHLFASPTATTSAVVGTASMVFFVFGGIAAAAALQEIYEQAFDLWATSVR